MPGGESRRVPTSQWSLIGSLVLAVALANIAQPYPDLAPLQHAPTLLLCLSAPWLLRRWPLSTGSVGLIWLFFLLHTLGGRYIYSYVPYDGWLATVAGRSVSEMFGWERNAYDRLIHLLFGLLWTPVLAEIAGRHGRLGHRAAWLMAFALVGLVSALYEIFEWLLTIVAAGDMADYYNGQQGDVWDAQKDMAIAQLGSLMAWLGTLLRRCAG